MNLKASKVALIYKNEIPYRKRISVKSSEEAHQLLISEVYDKETIEHHMSVKVILLNPACQVLGVADIAEGGVQESPVDIRSILQAALLTNASGIILSRNCPSGNTKPSDQDKALSKRLEEVLRLLNIKYQDFIIVSSDERFSFADEWLINSAY